MNIKRIIAILLGELYYPFFSLTRHRIMSIDDTIDRMSSGLCSIVRFGDGEFSILNGKGISNYQAFDSLLQEKMTDAITSYSVPNLLICLPESLDNLEFCKQESKTNWKLDFFLNRKSYKKYCNANYIYGNAFVSRPYMIYSDKTKCSKWFEKILSLFAKKDIVLVEGKYSRCGVGNNLFKEANSVRRIICPSQNAFDKYEEILNEVLKLDKACLVLLSIGPTSKPMAVDLVKRGYLVWDIGHIDSEYEWYLRGCEVKEELRGKHTAEKNTVIIGECQDKAYIMSIIADLS